MDNRSKLFVVIGTVALIACTGIGGFVLFTTKDTLSMQPSTLQTSTDKTTVSPVSSYRDGTYSASTSYNVPSGGQNAIKTTITVSGGKIVSVTSNGSYSDGESGMYVDSFNASISLDASGQSLAGYSPSRIGGASLTTAAFTNTLDTIRSDAKA